MNNIEKICPVYFIKNEVHFVVPGKPFAKQRPKASTRGRFVRVYTPRKTVNYENHVKEYYDTTTQKKLHGELTAEINSVFPVPKSASKKKANDMINGIIPHTQKPDCDNIAKICLDALNDIAYDDDSQINKLIVSKRFGAIPHVEIAIREN